jgi:hypothetical protein
MKTDHSPSRVRQYFDSCDDESLLRFFYCYDLGSAFVHLSKMEVGIIHAMAMCDRIKVSIVLGDDAKNWEKFVAKHKKLQASTLGNLVRILEKHSIAEADLNYLKWLKEKRDFFIHRWFQKEIWPGEMSIADCRVAIRQLMYLETIFGRAELEIWKVLGRAGLIAIKDLGSDGFIMANPDAMGEVFGDAWHDAAVAMTRQHIKRKKNRERKIGKRHGTQRRRGK